MPLKSLEEFRLTLNCSLEIRIAAESAAVAIRRPPATPFPQVKIATPKPNATKTAVRLRLESYTRGANGKATKGTAAKQAEIRADKAPLSSFLEGRWKVDH